MVSFVKNVDAKYQNRLTSYRSEEFDMKYLYRPKRKMGQIISKKNYRSLFGWTGCKCQHSQLTPPSPYHLTDALCSSFSFSQFSFFTHIYPSE